MRIYFSTYWNDYIFEILCGAKYSTYLWCPDLKDIFYYISPIDLEFICEVHND